MPIFEIGLLVLSLVSMFIAWRALQHFRELNSKLERMTTTLYQTRQEQRQQDEALQTRVAAMDVELQKMSGKLRFDPDRPLTELYEIEPRAQNVLAGFHIGGFSGNGAGRRGFAIGAGGR